MLSLLSPLCWYIQKEHYVQLLQTLVILTHRRAQYEYSN